VIGDWAATSRSTLLAVIIAVAGGSIVLVPSLFLLFLLFLRGRLDPAATPDAHPSPISHRRPRVLATLPSATFLIGPAVTVFADPGWPTRWA
jgi:cytochrome d ubiquinol oxidase subunit II